MTFHVQVGASDDLAHDRSTFMVEMVETATILSRATARSLVSFQLIRMLAEWELIVSGM